MSDIFANMPGSYSIPTQKQDIYTSKTIQPITVKEAISASNVKEQPTDSVQLSSQKEEKKGPIKSIKGFIANIKKFFATSTEYVKGTVKGVTSGVVAGSVVYTAGSILNFAKQKAANSAAKKAGVEAAKVIKKVPNKALAIVVGGLVLAANLWTASLNATEKSSNIDHRWTGHKQ